MATTRSTVLSVTIIRDEYTPDSGYAAIGPNPKYFVLTEGPKWRTSAAFATLAEASEYARKQFLEALSHAGTN